MSKEMVESVKQALKEIEEEKLHTQIHARIDLKLFRETPPGKYGFCRCGICNQMIEYRNNITAV